MHWLDQRPEFALCALLLVIVMFATACDVAAKSVDASTQLKPGDCISVTDIGEDDAAPVRRVPCGPPGTVISDIDVYAVYRIVFAITLQLPVMSRAGADDLARLFCTGPDISPGGSLYVFPTEASFAEGFTQFLCLSR